MGGIGSTAGQSEACAIDLTVDGQLWRRCAARACRRSATDRYPSGAPSPEPGEVCAKSSRTDLSYTRATAELHLSYTWDTEEPPRYAQRRGSPLGWTGRPRKQTRLKRESRRVAERVGVEVWIDRRDVEVKTTARPRARGSWLLAPRRFGAVRDSTWHARCAMDRSPGDRRYLDAVSTTERHRSTSGYDNATERHRGIGAPRCIAMNRRNGHLGLFYRGRRDGARKSATRFGGSIMRPGYS